MNLQEIGEQGNVKGLEVPLDVFRKLPLEDKIEIMYKGILINVRRGRRLSIHHVVTYSWLTGLSFAIGMILNKLVMAI